MSDLSMAWLFGALVGFFTGVFATYAYNAPGESVHTRARTLVDNSIMDDDDDLGDYWPDMDGVDDGEDVFSQHPVSGGAHAQQRNESGHTPYRTGGDGGLHPDGAQGPQIHDGDAGEVR